MCPQENDNGTPAVANGITLATGTTWFIATGLMTSVFVVAHFMIIAHLVPDISHLGMVSFIALFGQLAVILFTFSIPRASVRFVAKAVSVRDFGHIRALDSLLKRIGIACAALAGFTIFMLSDALSWVFFGSASMSTLLKGLAIDLVPLVFAYFPKQVLLGAQRYKRVSVIEIIQNAARYGLAVLLFASNMQLSSIVVGWTIGDLVGAILASCATAVMFKSEQESDTSPSGIGKFAGQLLGFAASDHLVQGLDKYVLLLIAGSASLGLYSPAATASSLVLIIPMMITSALYPHYTALSSGRTRQLLRNTELWVSRWISITFIPAAFGIASLAYAIITIIGGERYSAAAMALAVGAIAIGLTSPSAGINAKLLGQGNVLPLIAANCFSAVIGAIVGIILIPLLGTVGAALVRASVIIGVLVFTASFMKRSNDLVLDGRALFHAVSGSTLMMVVVVLAQLVLYSVWLVPLYVILGLLTYGGYLRAGHVMKRNDFSLLKRLVPQRLKPVIMTLERLLVGQE